MYDSLEMSKWNVSNAAKLLRKICDDDKTAEMFAVHAVIHDQEWLTNVAYYVANCDRDAHCGDWFVVCSVCQTLRLFGLKPTQAELTKMKCPNKTPHSTWTDQVYNEFKTVYIHRL